jgi:hypothetical protein
METNRSEQTEICQKFIHNKCTFNEDCKYLHDPNICFYFWKFNNCKFGNNCKKTHLEIHSQAQINVPDHQTSIKKQTKHYIKRSNVKRNTICFEPMTNPVDIRIVLDLRTSKDFTEKIFMPKLTSRDVLLSPSLFDDKENLYNKLVDEIKNCGISEDNLLKMWHGNNKIDGTHLIADDHKKWKDNCPTFNMIIERIKKAFCMDIKSTRFNWYRDPDHWKPFHHDSAFINEERALTQNFTVAISFGATKDAAFEHAKTKTVISIPQVNGTVYSFTNDTNAIWRHGILQDKIPQELGRISIIAWGWVDNIEQT